MGKRKKMTIFLLAVLCILAITPMTADAAKLKKVNVDKYLKKGRNYTILAYNPTNKWVKVRKKKSVHSSRWSLMLNYGGTLTVDRSKLKKGVKTSWIPVFMYEGRKRTTGYIQATQVKLAVVYNKKYSGNRIIDTAIKTGFRYLGTPFVMPGASLDHGIDCAQFVAAVYRAAGRNLVSWAHTDNLQAACYEIFYQRAQRTLSKSQMNRLKPGDLLFYLKNDTSGPIDHVGSYIGNGFMINSSGHYGMVYPNGGVCLKRVQYGNRKIMRAMRIRGF